MPERDVCGRCGQPLKSHESISVASVGLRCYRCFSEDTAAMMGVAFDNTPLQPVTVRDFDGVGHTFEFQSMLVTTGHALYARERVADEEGGYEFSVLGDFDANVWDLFRVLYDRIRDGLAIRHVEKGELGWRISDACHLVGRITWDSERAGEVPLLVIDGKPFTWDQVGRMLMSFEGFTLRAFVSDGIEVVGGPLLEKEKIANPFHLLRLWRRWHRRPHQSWKRGERRSGGLRASAHRAARPTPSIGSSSTTPSASRP